MRPPGSISTLEGLSFLAMSSASNSTVPCTLTEGARMFPHRRRRAPRVHVRQLVFECRPQERGTLTRETSGAGSVEARSCARGVAISDRSAWISASDGIETLSTVASSWRRGPNDRSGRLRTRTPDSRDVESGGFEGGSSGASGGVGSRREVLSPEPRGSVDGRAPVDGCNNPGRDR